MKRGKRFLIYGAYGSHAKAAREKPEGAFIVKRTIRRRTRYVVLKQRGK